MVVVRALTGDAALALTGDVRGEGFGEAAALVRARLGGEGPAAGTSTSVLDGADLRARAAPVRLLAITTASSQSVCMTGSDCAVELEAAAPPDTLLPAIAFTTDPAAALPARSTPVVV